MRWLQLVMNERPEIPNLDHSNERHIPCLSRSISSFALEGNLTRKIERFSAS